MIICKLLVLDGEGLHGREHASGPLPRRFADGNHFGPSGSNLMEEFPQQALLNPPPTADAGDVLRVVWGRCAASDIFHHAALIDRPEPWVLSASQR